MTRGLAHPRTHRFFETAARDNKPFLSGTPYREFLKTKAKTSMEVVFISAIVAWAFVVPLFRDSLIQAIGNWLQVP